jgi:hypothetical protein
MSTGLDCGFFKASDGKWYMYLEDSCYRDVYNDYGPFNSQEEADRYLSRNFANPGGYNVDDSGKSKPPTNPIKKR